MKPLSNKQLQDWDAFVQSDAPHPSTDLMETILKSLCIPYTFLTKSFVASLLKNRKPFSHKGTYGHALLIAGNPGKMGAALLAAKAALRTGVGLLTVAVPEKESSVIHIALPEAMVADREAATTGLDRYDAIGAGPGLGTGLHTQQQIGKLIRQNTRPMVLDADALNVVSMNRDLLQELPEETVLTPHPKEFDRMFGPSETDFERWQKAIAASQLYNCVVLVKGHFTLIASAGKAWFNTTGNAGLAKGGSGDVLTGMITALLAQGYSAEAAAQLGVYLHGLAADIALESQSVETVLATDLIEAIGKAFLQLREINR
ncbi:MAG TPA: NAD(P)H-hydrate dehydratase [Sediminibacterium sp.]|nr:NAD(P)H-hydrate dehydratase [Sediminibacterium sp.]